MIVLNNDQQNKLVQQYVELVVDNMDRKTMEEWITEELIFKFEKLTKEELKERVDCYDDELFDELVDNVTQQYPKQLNTFEKDNAPVIINLPEGTNLTRVIRSDDDYASKVDTLVDNMVASDDNLFTHDSEGC